jgi:LPXTG-motif cell wall-anchored protein
MQTRVPILAMVALLALALLAPAALAQDDDDGDDDYGAATASATATAASTATAGSDDDDYDDAAELPNTGGPALIAPLAGVLLLGFGVLADRVALRLNQ